MTETVKDKKQNNLASVIKYEGNNQTLVWKHPEEDFKLGSQLIVHESQEAIFFRDGQALDLFGPGRYTLETQQIPLLENAYKLATDEKETFHTEVYYINKSVIMNTRWGTDSKIRLFDPGSGLHLEIGACGEFNIQVADSRKLLCKLVGTTSEVEQLQLVGVDNGKGYFRALVMTQVKSYLAQTIKHQDVNILEIDAHLLALSEELKQRLNEYLQSYGLEILEFFITRINTPDDDPNFKRLKLQYAEKYLLVRQEEIKKLEAEAAAKRMEVETANLARLKIIETQGQAEAMKIKAQAEAEAYRAKAQAEALEMQMKGYTYQQETARMVGLEAMKNGLGGGGEGGNGGSLGGGLGDLANLGMSLGALGGVMAITKEALNPVTSMAMEMGSTMGGVMQNGMNTWDCVCGAKGRTGNFCSSCGAKAPTVKAGWTCSCGAQGNVENFCPNCGKRKED